MDKNILWINKKKALKTIEALEENNMNGYLVSSKEELIEKIEELVEPMDRVSCGSSITLLETGVIEHLRSGRYDFVDRYKEGTTKDELEQICRQAFFCDTFFLSSNAITEDGMLYNVDGKGSRVAPLLYGPDKIIIIAGTNKIVPNLEDAIKRNRTICGPANAKRLNRNTPCATSGYCMNCNSKERICNEYTVIKNQIDKGRIHVIFIEEYQGY